MRESDLSVAHYLNAVPLGAETRVTYSYGLKAFEDWLQVAGRQIHEATTTDVTSYLSHLRKEGRPESTVVGRFYNLRGYFRWLESVGAVSRSPMAQLRAQSIEATYPDVVSVDDLRALLSHARGDKAWLLIAILGFNGLRVSELLNCHVSNLERRDGFTYLRFVAGTNRHRLPIAPLAPEVSVVLDRVLNGRRSGPLLTTARGTKMHRSTAAGAIRVAGERAGLTYEVTPQMLSYTLPVAAIEYGFSFTSLLKSSGVPQPRHSDRWLNTDQPLTRDNGSLRLARLVLQEGDSTENLLSSVEALLADKSSPEPIILMAAGAIFERHLRALALQAGSPTPTDPQQLGRISKWAGELQSRGIVRSADRQIIDAIGNVRNLAAHGYFERLHPGEAERTLRSIREVMSRYPLSDL